MDKVKIGGHTPMSDMAMVERDDGWTMHRGDQRPSGIGPNEWLEVRCLSGAINLNVARKILWGSELDGKNFAYWTVLAWRRFSSALTSTAG